MSNPVRRYEPALRPIGATRTSKALELLSAAGDQRIKPLMVGARKLKSDISFAKFLRLRGEVSLAYQYASHQFGFIPSVGANPPATMAVADAGAMEPDKALQNQELMITLDRLRVYDYPGKGRHVILVDFSAEHSTSTGKQELRFSHKYIANEKDAAGVRGFPIFKGLRSDAQGIAFSVSTVNVENDDDRKILEFMDSDVLQKGLSVINAVNPAIPVISGLVSGIVKTFASRHKNIVVQSFFLGLDFSKVPGRARLCEGDYICVQAPDDDWDWGQWRWNCSRGTIESVNPPHKGIPYNYMLIGVSKLIP